MSSSVGRPLGGGRSRSRAGRGAEAAGRRGASLGTSAARRGGPDCLIDYFPVKDILGGGVTWPRDVGRPAVKSRKTRSAAAPSTKSRGRTAPFRSVPFRPSAPSGPPRPVRRSQRWQRWQPRGRAPTALLCALPRLFGLFQQRRRGAELQRWPLINL